MDIDVKMAEIAVAKAADNLVVSGIGSCLAIMLYDSKRKIGGLAHAMLPSSVAHHPSSVTRHETQDTKYVNIAIDEMLRKMLSQGSKREDLEAKLVGGANMFAAFKSDIGRENVVSAEEKLKKEGIKIVGESTGGSIGRSVEFSVASGIVTVKIKF